MLKLDSLDRKPKLWSVLGVALATAAALGLVLWLAPGEPQKLLLAQGILCLGLTAVLILTLRALLRQIRYNLYSYNTIFYSGFLLYGLFEWVRSLLFLGTLFSSYEELQYMTALNVLAGNLAAGPRDFMLVTTPFLLVFSVALLISTFVLVRHEGFHPGNLLGALLVLAVIGAEAVDYVNNYYVMGSEFEVMLHDLLWNTFAAVFLYFECMLLGVLIANILAVKVRPPLDRDFMILLGCGIRNDGTPTPLLQGRIDRGLAFYRRQLQETGKPLIFIPSGGQGPDEVISEAQCMKNYLLSQGVPEEHIRLEDRSTSTYENMSFSKQVLEGVDPAGKVAFSTSNYHVFRSGIIARRVKLRAQGVGARTKWYFWPNAAVREFAGIASSHRLKQAMILLGLVLLFLALTFFSYRIY